MTSASIRHMVIFNLKHAAGSPEAEQFLEDGRTQLTSIPGVTRFEVFRQVSPKNDYEYGFSMDFADGTAYEAYNAHPVHTAFVSERWEKEVTRFLEIDFQAVPARG
ncbi:Dabb family protein [Paenibacillus mucilaginosus]|uniref:Stress responsive alpha-beta barrel domain-containing protein n=2 Tax=Paenibacillus mucilaginosus TaxID=61624 RepID=H6NKB2_9BACL|nr:Dabb family protein [Paenibacillus mucilaginosus]AEI44014.1 Stress responsive alpha-beta barrel domain protein [Paenibacillus mucilaginosus KNP414]AFC31596.1 Stress responsive alpha-beta barrel domain-containing protein [Paenibacillus mucilaginosus 3016]MCG7212497.1 Dabb family protein [Paenibacillus mucilaginosus]WDM25469.1 Dabb family protein [Paenibacillus mucilaginosus]WFA20133.1 Dabb family protein [Paenibacillus mucilaginosus]